MLNCILPLLSLEWYFRSFLVWGTRGHENNCFPSPALAEFRTTCRLRKTYVVSFLLWPKVQILVCFRDSSDKSRHQPSSKLAKILLATNKTPCAITLRPAPRSVALKITPYTPCVITLRPAPRSVALKPRSNVPVNISLEFY